MYEAKDLQEQRTKLLLDAQEILKNNPDAEKRASAHKMIADADAKEQDITALAKIAKFEAEERNRTAPNRDMIVTPETSVKDKDKAAWRNWMRTGTTSASIYSDGTIGGSAPELRTAGITTSGANSSYSGAALIPQSMYGILTDALKSPGQLLEKVTIHYTDTGEPFKIATDNDTANLLTEIAENTAVSETDPTINSAVVLNSSFWTTGVVKVSLMELNQSNFDVEQWLRRSFGLRYQRGLTEMITTGSSSGAVASLKTTASVGATTASPTAIAWSDLTAVYAALDPAYHPNAAWSFNSATRGYLLGLTDTLGRPLYTVNQLSSTVAGAFTDSIMGHPVVISQYMDAPNVATNIPILFGDHSAYFLRVVNPGLVIYRLQELYMASGMVGFVGFGMGGGTLVDAGTHPILSLEMHS